jgi:predicted metal-dependent peptidase
MNDPFMAALHLPLNKIYTTEIERACTNGVDLIINPVWFNSLTDSQREMVCAHEGLHPALGHCGAKSDIKKMTAFPNDMLCNIAMDHAINLLLKSAGYAITDDAYCDKQFTDMSWEQIYRILDAQNTKTSSTTTCNVIGQGIPDDSDADGQSIPDDSDADGKIANPVDSIPGDIDKQLVEAEIKIRVSIAEAEAKKRGKLGATQQRVIDQLLKPKIHWPSTLEHLLQHIRGIEESWTKPNRRYVSQGMYLPDVNPEPRLPPVFIAGDSSGSVNKHEIEQFWSEIRDIMASLKPELVYFAWCSSYLGKVFELEADNMPNEPIWPDVSGGTDFEPPFQYIDKHNIEPAAVIYFTDGHAPTNFKEPDYPVIWITTGRVDLSFGDVIKMEM